MPLTDYRTASQLELELKGRRCEIIEFNRTTYSHFGFYIGDGICVHVQAPYGSDSASLISLVSASSSSTKSGSKTISKRGTKRAQRLVDIASGDPCRVNNLTHVAESLGWRPRPYAEAIRLALNSLPKDKNGQVILGESIEIDYNLISNNNCEGWVTHWKYEDNTGLSAQAANGLINSTFGTLERVSDRVLFHTDKILEDENANVVLKANATLAAGTYKTIGETCMIIRTTTDTVIGKFHQILKN